MPGTYYKNNAVYQIYPRSFCDSNGDGIGDIPGIISKLDYLKDLGIGIIWLSPVYRSPDVDYGYDISDYCDINPEYGTMADMERLIKEAGERGIRVVMDLVINHTSDRHKWFAASKDPASPYADYYIWRRGRDCNRKPPNNWTSVFAGPAWEYCRERGLWYLHIFSAAQPDLNWDNPKVLDEIERVILFWLDKGIYGFRCDAVNYIYKSTLADGKDNFVHTSVGMEHYLNQVGAHKILHRLWKDIFSERDAMTVGETNGITYEQGNEYVSQELDMAFHFDHLDHRFSILRPGHEKPISPKKFKAKIIGWQTHMDWNANVLENHDQLRSVSRFAKSGRYRTELAKMLAMLNIFLRGTPFIYNGEEIGMSDYPEHRLSETRDLVAKGIFRMVSGAHLPRMVALGMASAYNRDNARAPFQWSGEANAGFSSAEPWLPVNPDYRRYNAADEGKDPGSVLSFYRQALALHRNSRALRTGSIVFHKTSGRVLWFTRSDGEESFSVVLNLSSHKAHLPSSAGAGKILLSDYPQAADGKRLRPYEARLLRIK